GDRSLLGRATYRLGQAMINAGAAGDAAEVMEAALAETPLDGGDGLDESQARMLAGLAHAYQRSAQYERCLSAADRAMAAAEVLDLPDVVAAAMVSKSTALSRMGRRREAVALLEGAVRLAAETGEITLELRARNNLATVTGQDDPARAWEILRAGLALAE